MAPDILSYMRGDVGSGWKGRVERRNQAVQITKKKAIFRSQTAPLKVSQHKSLDYSLDDHKV